VASLRLLALVGLFGQGSGGLHSAAVGAFFASFARLVVADSFIERPRSPALSCALLRSPALSCALLRSPALSCALLRSPALSCDLFALPMSELAAKPSD
jgi:hypothetical protein